jgi:hypothetical protein
LQHLIRKAGCRVDWQLVVNSTVKLTRYQSTTCSLSYKEHVELMKITHSGGTAKAGSPTTGDTVKSGVRSKRSSLVTVPAA